MPDAIVWKTIRKARTDPSWFDVHLSRTFAQRRLTVQWADALSDDAAAAAATAGRSAATFSR